MSLPDALQSAFCLLQARIFVVPCIPLLLCNAAACQLENVNQHRLQTTFVHPVCLCCVSVSFLQKQNCCYICSSDHLVLVAARLSLRQTW